MTDLLPDLNQSSPQSKLELHDDEHVPKDMGDINVNPTTGFIKIYKSILKHWVMRDPLLGWLWIHLLLSANWKPRSWLYNGVMYHCERGQCVISIRKLASAIRPKSTFDKLSSRLNLLETQHMIRQERQRHGTKITICNYDKYQGNDKEESDSNPTQNPCLSQLSPDSQPTHTRPPKNIKKEKKEKKIIPTPPDKKPYPTEESPILLSDDEVRKLESAMSVGELHYWIASLSGYANSNPARFSKYQSHYKTILTWRTKDKLKGYVNGGMR